MVEHELLMLAIEARWPYLVHGKDYLVGHPLDASGAHCGDAYILRWATTTVPEPDAAMVATLLKEAVAQRPVLMGRQARSQRNSLLSACDWTQGADAPEEKRAAWAEYRQALRDLPTQPDFPIKITWPVKPQ